MDYRFTAKDAIRYLKIDKSTLRRWEREGQITKFEHYDDKGRRVYSIEELDIIKREKHRDYVEVITSGTGGRVIFSENGTRLYTIKGAAQSVGVAICTIRNWERKGKIRPADRRPQNNERYYTNDDIAYLQKRREAILMEEQKARDDRLRTVNLNNQPRVV